MKKSSLISLKTSLGSLAIVGLCASSWQLAQAIPQTVQPNAQTTPYKALSVHDAKWLKEHPHYVVAPKKGWIKVLPHRYRIVKVHNQTYYYAHNHYYQRNATGFVVVKIPL